MLTITKVKVGIDTVYEKVYYDGTQQELENQLNGISTIPFLQQKKCLFQKIPVQELSH